MLNLLENTNRLDEITSAYIGLLDVYCELNHDVVHTDADFKNLCRQASLFLIKSVAAVPGHEKMNFCLKACTWICFQQLAHVDQQSIFHSGQPVIGSEDLQRCLGQQ